MPVLGMSEFRAAVVKVTVEMDAAARATVVKAAAFLERKTKANFEGVHTKGESHVGGDRPNVVTGTARRSVRSDPIRRYAVGDYSQRVVLRAIYYRCLELGYPGE